MTEHNTAGMQATAGRKQNRTDNTVQMTAKSRILAKEVKPATACREANNVIDTTL
jgi:hypothetical protein